MGDIPSIGDVVRQWRRFYKLNVTEFAKQAGLSKGYISELENNKIDNPTPPNLEKLAAAIGVSVLELHARKLPGDGANISAVDRAAPTLQESEEDDLIFASPLKTPRRRSNEVTQLQQLLARVDDLRAMIEALIAEKEQNHGRTERS
jgi:transcriptional regulator with XRE-family HTH domain